jgi:hypothetical protein
MAQSSIGVGWITAFVDLAPADHERGLALWEALTGYRRSVTRGVAGEFVTLDPPTGDAYLRVQRLGTGPSRVHLDLHVDEPWLAAEQAVALGAQPMADHGDYLVLSSPGGLTFCVVPTPAASVPPATVWPDGTRSRVDQVCLDISPSSYDAEFAFWAALTGWEARPPSAETEFARLTPPLGVPMTLLLQRLDDEQPTVTAHLDWCASDPEAEVVRHEAAGATRGARFPRGWTVLTGPDGFPYCVTPRPPH